jgi:hypothetical protein
MSLSVTAEHAVGRERSLSLSGMLQSYGVSVIPTAVVREHMRTTVLEHRQGIYKILGVFLYAVGLLGFKMVASEHSGKITLSLLGVTIVSIYGWVTQVPFAAIVCLIVGGVLVLMIARLIAVSMVIEKSGLDSPFVRASMMWQDNPLDTESALSLSKAGVPDHLLDRTLRAARVPGAKISILRFGLDPILEVRLPGFFSEERAYIGGWGTGNDAIDKAV